MKYFLSSWVVVGTLLGLPNEASIQNGSMQQYLKDGHLQLVTKDKTIINWREFSVGKNEVVQFVQPNQESLVLNRVTGSNISEILGEISSNGTIYLINKNGVLFGSDSIINTAGFLASTHDLSDRDFIAAKELLFKGDSKSSIINYGTIKAQDGHVTLIAKVIENHGEIIAKQGQVSLNAGLEVLLKPEEIPILSIRATKDRESNILSAGSIEALSISLQVDDGAHAHGINLEGAILATNPVSENGKIYLKADRIETKSSSSLKAPGGLIDAEAGQFFNQGILDASGDSGGKVTLLVDRFTNTNQILAEGKSGDGGEVSIHAKTSYIETKDGKISTSSEKNGGNISIQSDASFFSSGSLISNGEVGGEIIVLSPKITLMSASVTSDGQIQGGNIFIGGGAHGEIKGAFNAQNTRLGGFTHLSASAKDKGDGGQIVVWADGVTSTYGAIEAKAGPNGGDGGWIEVSGLEGLSSNAHISANAPRGKNGSLLFDPIDITIDNIFMIPQIEYVDPSGSPGIEFGKNILALPSNNIAIASPNDSGGNGAVYLFDMKTAALISTLQGDSVDHVGSGSLTLLSNGNYVVCSPDWTNGSMTSGAGAVTLCDGTTGLNGFVSTSNSFYGANINDHIGSEGVIALTNGNFVALSASWNGGFGAATWGNGTALTGFSVDSTNSLVGSSANDFFFASIYPLINGNYVVRTAFWDNGAATDAGAATWGDGAIGTSGVISDTISLVGSNSNDSIGLNFIEILGDGFNNYVVSSENWNPSPIIFSAGAATWCSGASANPVGVVSASNSLVGTVDYDLVGIQLTALTNGNYVVGSPNWDISDVGAATWAAGATGITGAVNFSNSLVGPNEGSYVGQRTIALSNGNYVVLSSASLTGSYTLEGAATWGDGTTGIIGNVSTGNSLYGKENDSVGGEGIALTNGNYLIGSPFWSTIANTYTFEGAVTWCDGTGPTSALVDTSNSLYGTSANDKVGGGNPCGIALSNKNNGNYVVLSPNWDGDKGAATWGNGSGGTTGAVSNLNSLVGSTAGDLIGLLGVALTNDNYVIYSPNWNNGGSISNAGAATWGNGSGGTVGNVTEFNSLVGISMNDSISNGGVKTLSNGNYVVVSTVYGIMDQGAVTFGDGAMGTVGNVDPYNSLTGGLNDIAGSGGVIETQNGNYLVISPSSNMSAGAVTLAPIGATINSQSSLLGQSPSAGLQINMIFYNENLNLFAASFFTEGNGKVRSSIGSYSPLDYASPPNSLTVPTVNISGILSSGTDVTLQASNDLTLASSLNQTSPDTQSATLTLSAGKSVNINADIDFTKLSLEVIANDLLANGVVDADRSAGDAVLSIANGVAISVGGSVSFSLLDGAGKTNSASGDITIGDGASITVSGANTIDIFAQVNNVSLGNGATLTTQDGNLTITAGNAIIAVDPAILETTGLGELVLISDNLYPTPPTYGPGYISLPMATLTTAGAKLLLYTADRPLNTMPAMINGVAYVPGPELVDSTTEKWGTYYPSSSGIPFTIFYKTGYVPPSPPPPSPPSPGPTPGPSSFSLDVTTAQYDLVTALMEAFVMWNPFLYEDEYLFGKQYPHREPYRLYFYPKRGEEIQLIKKKPR